MSILKTRIFVITFLEFPNVKLWSDSVEIFKVLLQAAQMPLKNAIASLHSH